jgi:hypothetical protein
MVHELRAARMSGFEWGPESRLSQWDDGKGCRLLFSWGGFSRVFPSLEEFDNPVNGFQRFFLRASIVYPWESLGS